MGFGSFFNNLGRSISSGFTSFKGTVTSGYHSFVHNVVPVVRNVGIGAWGIARTGVTGIAHELKSGISTIHQDARDYVTGFKNLIQHNVDKVHDTINHTVDRGSGAITGAANALSLPLSVGVGAAALLGGLFLLKK